MSRIKKLCFPSRTDGVLLVGLFLIVIGFAFHDFALFYELEFGGVEEFAYVMTVPFTIVALACAACFGWWRFGRWRLLLLLLFAIASPYLPFLLHQIAGNGWFLNQSLFNQWYWFNNQPRTSIFEWVTFLSGSALTAFACGFVLIWLLRFVPPKIANRLQRTGGELSSRLEFSRTGVLIGIAVFLMIIGVVNNVLLANGVNLFRGNSIGNYGFLEMVVSIGFALVVFGVVIAWPSWSILHGDHFWVHVGGVVTLVAPAAVFFNWQIAEHGFSWELVLATGLLTMGSVVFLVAVVCLKNGKENIASYPSLWSLLTLAFSVLLFASPKLIDYVQLASQNHRTLSERIDAAIESGWLAWRTDGQIRGVGGAFYEIRIRPTTDPGLLNSPEARAVGGYLVFSDMNPSIDTTPLSNKSINAVNIFRGQIDTTQLEHLTKSANYVFIQNVDLKKNSAPVDIEVNGTLQIFHEREGSVGKFLAGINKCKGQSGISVMSQVSNADWGEILRVSQSCPVTLQGGVVPGFTFDGSNELSAKNITLNLGTTNPEFPIAKEKIRFFLNTDAKIWPFVLLNRPQIFWDLVISVPHRLNASQIFDQQMLQLQSAQSRNRGDFSLFKNYHLAYGQDENGNITSLYLPNGYDLPIPQASTIKSLSFDPSWLVESNLVLANSKVVESTRSLERLTNLEELYFSDCQIDAKLLSFLSKLNKLKHLQIPSVKRRPGTVGFDVVSSLESITFIGRPDVQSLKELSRLQKLKKVVVSDALNEVADIDKDKKTLSKLLPDVEVSILPFAEHQPTVPADFKRHCEEVRQKVFEKYSATLKPEDKAPK